MRAIAANFGVCAPAVENDSGVCVGRAISLDAKEQELPRSTTAAHAQAGVFAVDVNGGRVGITQRSVCSKQEDVAVQAAPAHQEVGEIPAQLDRGYVLVSTQNLHKAAEGLCHDQFSRLILVVC